MRSDDELHDVESADLLVQLKRLVVSSNELTAQLSAHLAEVDARGIYRDCACATLYAAEVAPWADAPSLIQTFGPRVARDGFRGAGSPGVHVGRVGARVGRSSTAARAR